MIGARNVKAGLALLALSLVGGLAMSLYAFQPMVKTPPGLDQYDDLPRRLIRLAHIAAVMLPLLNVVLGFVIDRVRLSPGKKNLASALLLAGAIGLPAALAAEAAWAPLRPWHPSGAPAVAFTAGTVLLALGAWRTPGRILVGGALDAPSAASLQWIQAEQRGDPWRSSNTSPKTESRLSRSTSLPRTATPMK